MHKLVAGGLALALALGTWTAISQAEQGRPDLVIKGFKTPRPKVVFNGDLNADKKACVEDRKVILTQTDDGIRAGTGKTKAKGAWEISFRGSDVPPGIFVARAPAKDVGNVNCPKRVSPPFDASPSGR